MLKNQLFIRNRYEDSVSGEVFPVTNPLDNSVLTEVAAASAEDVDRAVRAARKAFPAWSATPGEDRGRLMRRAAELIGEHLDELATIETRDTGKPIVDSRDIDMALSIKAMDYYGCLAGDLRGESLEIAGGPYLDYTVYEPIGVVGVIIPWNFPLHIATRGLAPALAAGNTVVLKPAELAPLTPIAFGELLIEAGFPPGVVNVVPGIGEVAGAALAEHPDVDMINFTGSTEVGRFIMHAAARDMKRVALELGGKSPNIVFADADIDKAVNVTIWGFCANQGETCCAGTRLLLHENVYDEFLEKLVERCNRIVLGNGLDEKTQMGPLISPGQLEKVDGYVTGALAAGARAACGGKRPDDPALAKGNFYLPTVLTGVTNNMTCAREEIFGPVLVVIRFTEEAEAVRLANDSDYGLAAGLWTRDINTAHRVARELRAGYVWINTFNFVPIQGPYGGYKKSGIGREYGLQGLRQCQEVKNVLVDLTETGIDRYEFSQQQGRD